MTEYIDTNKIGHRQIMFDVYRAITKSEVNNTDHVIISRELLEILCHHAETMYEQLQPKKVIQYLEINPDKSNWQDNPGYIYFIQDIDHTKNIKIGRSKDVDKRFLQFNTPIPFNIQIMHRIKCSDYISAENFFHKFFENKRVKGEWFKLSDLDIQSIKQIEEL